VAAALLWLCLVAAQGCLIPQDDVVFPDLPDQKNLPLQIKGHTPGPDREQTVFVGDGCATPTSISVTVVEPNADDSTTSVWYVDRTTTSPQADQEITTYGGSNQRIVVAPGGVYRSLKAAIDGKRHVLEVFVTDGNFTPGDVTTASRPPYGRTDAGLLSDPAYVDTFLWLVQPENCP
jgi:hypothetical protein